MTSIDNKNKSQCEYYAFSYLKGKLTKWKIISIILFIVLVLNIIEKKSNIFTPMNDKSTKTNSIENIKENFIPKIEIDKPIMESEDKFVSNIIQKIKKLETKKEVMGLILIINSPGGSVFGSFELYDAIKSFKQNTKKPVVAVIKDFGTSGAYLASVASDYIFANSVSIVGSVGALMQLIDMTDLASKIGIKVTAFRSGSLKALPNQFEKSTDESNIMMKNIINDFKIQFLSKVRENRKSITDENFKEIEKAGIFTGIMAKNIGLIDEIGDEDSSKLWIENKNNLKNLEVINIALEKENNTGLTNLLKRGVSLASSINSGFKKSNFYFMTDLM